MLAIGLGFGQYDIGLGIGKLTLEMKDTVIRPEDFNAAEYAHATNLSTIFISAAIDFDLEGDNGSIFLLDKTLEEVFNMFNTPSEDGESNETMDMISSLGLAPALKVLSTISNHYRLEATANLNLTEVLDSNNQLGYPTFYKTNFKVVLRNRDKTIIENGVEVMEEVASVHYHDQVGYLNAAAFNLQPVKADDFYTNLLIIIEIMRSAFQEDEDYEEGGNLPPQNAGGVGGFRYNNFDPFSIFNLPEGGMSSNIAYLKLSLSKKGFGISIGTAALFGVLGLISGDLAGYSALVNPVGEINIEALLFNS